MTYTIRPLVDRTWMRTPSQRKYSPFDSHWDNTRKLLEYEVGRLNGKNLVLELDISEADLKLDGTLRAKAKVTSPAVIVAFDTAKHGPVLFRCDTYESRYYGRDDWRENVRAIALTLEALRTVDRYGATDTGQQYTGFKALPAGRAMPASHMTSDEAVAIIAEWADIPERDVRPNLPNSWRAARAYVHPDRWGGERERWDKVEEAGRVLGVR